MQAASDIFLGWQRFAGLDGKTRDFYVRQLRDWKFSVDIAAMNAGAAPTINDAFPARVRATPSTKKSWYSPLPSAPRRRSATMSRRGRLIPPPTNAAARRISAATPTRRPVNATGLKMCVAYLTTTKFTPQITAIVKRRISVNPYAGCAAGSAVIAEGWVADSVIDEN
jgi:hypothetical protein